MIRNTYFITGFVLFQVLILPLMVLCYLFRTIGLEKACRALTAWVTHIWGRSSLFMAGAKVTVHGHLDLPKDQAVLFVGNHQSDFDIPLWLAHAGRPVGFVAKIELRKIPSLGAWMVLSKCVFLDRGNRRSSVETIKQTIAHLQDGWSMVIFPEGTRSGSSEMAAFKKGSLLIGVKAGVPIVPVTVKNSHGLINREAKKIQKAHVDLFIDEPIFSDKLSEKEREELHIRVQGQIQAHLDDELNDKKL